MSGLEAGALNHDRVFQASWNDQLRDKEGCWNEIGMTIKKIVFFIPNLILAAIFNLRFESKTDDLRLSTLEDRVVEIKRVTTPDNVHLRVRLETQKTFTPCTPTVVLFNPLGTNYGFHDELAEKLLEKKCNVVRFDYRGFGTTRRGKDLIVDGESVYQCIVNELKIDPKKVHFYGTSLGGAIAAQVKALHPESGKFVSDRSFKSVFSLITEKCSVSRLGKTIEKITTFVVSILIAYPIKLLGWGFDSIGLQLGKDKLGIYHPNDLLVPLKASLATEFEESQQIRLDSKKTGGITHFSPIEVHKVDGTDQNAIDRVCHFLAE